MKVALVGLPGAGKTTLFNALAAQPVDVLPGVAGGAPHVTMLTVEDERLAWLRDLYEPKKYTPATLQLEDHAGIPAGSARKDRKGELFGKMRDADGLVVVLRRFTTDRYAYDEAEADPARDLELVALEFLSADLEICERRLERLEAEWKRPKERDRVEREQAAVRKIHALLSDGVGAFRAELTSEERGFVKGFQLLTSKPVVLVTNLAEGVDAGALESPALDVLSRFDVCALLESDLAQLDGEEREMFAAEYGVEEPLSVRFPMACYRGLGLDSFFTVGEDEVRAWTIPRGESAVNAAGAIHSDLQKGFIRAEVAAYADLREAGSMKEVRSRGRQRLEGKDYVVQDGDILNIRFSV